MRRLSVLLLAGMALVAMSAVGATSAAAETKKKKKIVETTVTVAFTPGAGQGEEYTSARFSGKVGSPKAKCVPDRNVSVNRVNGPVLGQTKSAANGDWSLLTPSPVTPGQYSVTVDKAKFIKNKVKPNGTKVKKKVVCQPASETITVP